MAQWMIVPNDDDIVHFGVKRRSGRYPWGSGERPYQSREQKHAARVQKRVERVENREAKKTAKFQTKAEAQSVKICNVRRKLDEAAAMHAKPRGALARKMAMEDAMYSNLKKEPTQRYKDKQLVRSGVKLAQKMAQTFPQNRIDAIIKYHDAYVKAQREGPEATAKFLVKQKQLQRDSLLISGVVTNTKGVTPVPVPGGIVLKKNQDAVYYSYDIRDVAKMQTVHYVKL